MSFKPPTSETTAAAATAAAAAAAVKALLKWKDAQSAIQKPQLLPQDDFIYLNLTLKKIPPKARTNPFRIPLPHPIFEPSSELCLIIDDRPTSNLTSEAAKKIIKSQNIPISKVLKLSKLKSNYKPFEAKRKLCDSYDLFLVDRRIVHLLPKLLGKFFFKKKKLPLPLDLTHKNWKEQIDRATGCGLLYMRTGTCCVIKVGKMSLESEEIVENVVQAINGVVEVVPKKWGGVRSLHLKFSDSLALPVYQALPDVKFRIEGVKESVKQNDTDAGVKEETRGDERKGKKKKKGRIHEVRYMDAGVGGDELDSEDDQEENEGKKVEGGEFVDSDGESDEEWAEKEDGDEKGFTHDESDGKESEMSEEDNDDHDNKDGVHGFSSAHSSGGKRKMAKMEKGKKAGRVENTGNRTPKANRLSVEDAEESAAKKVSKKNKVGKRLKEGSAAKKGKAGKTRV